MEKLKYDIQEILQSEFLIINWFQMMNIEH